MHFRDSGIIYGPFWGSFAVVDELRYCTVHLSFISTQSNKNVTKTNQSIIKRNKGNQSGVQRGHQGGPRGFHHCIKKQDERLFQQMVMNIYRWDSKDSPHQKHFKTPDVAGPQLICYGRDVTWL